MYVYACVRAYVRTCVRACVSVRERERESFGLCNAIEVFKRTLD